MIKIRKNTAKRLYYKEHKDIYVMPCNMCIGSMWFTPIKITGDFDSFINECMYYNCNNETGKYLHFYIDK